MNREFRVFWTWGICVLAIPPGRCGGSRAWPGTAQGVMGGVARLHGKDYLVLGVIGD